MNRDDIITSLKECEQLTDKLSKLIDDIRYFCEDSLSNIEIAKDAITYAVNPCSWDASNEDNLCYKNEPEAREAYFKGIKRGCSCALFWIADYFGDETIEFFENKIGYNFEHIKE